MIKYETLDESKHIEVDRKFKSVNVLDGIGFVELQDIMGDDTAIVNAARTSYLGETKGAEKDAKLLFYLMENNHTSPFEHAIFKFRVKAPLMVINQWVRHRTWSFNFSSFRYLEAEENEFYIPEVWRLQSKDNKQGSNDVLDDRDSEMLTELMKINIKLSYADYEQAIKLGVAREEARLFLPSYALYTTGIMTVDAWNLLHFLKLRMDKHAQFEIRQYANIIYNEFLKPILPITAQAFEKYILKVSNDDNNL